MHSAENFEKAWAFEIKEKGEGRMHVECTGYDVYGDSYRTLVEYSDTRYDEVQIFSGGELVARIPVGDVWRVMRI